MTLARIRGDGIAGLTMAKLLHQQGWNIELHGMPPSRKPVIVLSRETLQLLEKVWGLSKDRLPEGHGITQRKVVINGQSTVTAFDALAVPLQMLASTLEDLLRKQHKLTKILNRLDPEDSGCDLFVDAGGKCEVHPVPFESRQQHLYGHRTVLTAFCDHDSLDDQCELHAQAGAWIFFTPIDQNTAMVQIMLPGTVEASMSAVESVIKQCPEVASRIRSDLRDIGSFPATPTFTAPAIGIGWLAVGDAVMAFDPVCGDGTGFALRGAILAAAVINGIQHGLDPLDCMGYYAHRLRRTFSAHLKHCLSYYTGAFTAQAWDNTLQAMLQPLPPFSGMEYRNSLTLYHLRAGEHMVLEKNNRLRADPV